MKIHFTASLEGKKETYQKIISVIKELNYELVTDHILTRKIGDVKNETTEESEKYVRKMMGWIKKADCVVSEVTHSEVSVGYEITIALNLGKPVIVLYQKGCEPHALKGLSSEKLQVCAYNTDNIKDVLKDAFEDAQDQIDVRFNFFISPTIGVYLDWISKFKKIPRAVYLRRLIEEDMKKNKEFKA